MSLLPRLGKSKLIPLLTTLVLLLSVITGVALVQRQQELRTKAAGNIYYVATNGSDSNPGTLAKPWRTIAKANNTLQAGDTVRIRSGTYNEVIEPVRSGSSGNPITYTNYQNEEAVIRGNSAQTYITKISGSYTVIDSLTFRHGYRVTGNSCWVCIDSSSSTNNVVRNNKIVTQDTELNWSLSKRRSYLDDGIRITRARDTLIEKNFIKGMGFGVHPTKAPKRTVIRGNTIASTMLDTIRFGSIGGPPEIQGILIENNILEGSTISDGIQTSQNFDLSEAEQEKDVSNLGIVIRNNIIRNNAENAIDLKGAGNIVIEGNIIYGTVGSSDGPLVKWNRNSLGTIIRGANTTSRDVIIRNNVLYDNSNGPLLYDGYRTYNNTLLANNRDYTGPNSTWTRTRKPDFNGIRQIEGDIAVKNNIIVSHTTAEATLRSSIGSSFINNNIYYNSSGVYLADFRGNNDWDRIPFSLWTSYLQGFSRISGKDAQSIVCKPEFVNVPSSLRPVGVHTEFDFRYTGNCSIVGAPLTFTAGASSGREIRVQDARYFFDGYGVVSGDEIVVGSNSPVTITTINYSTNTITVDRSISWKSNNSVTLRFPGSTPPVGAFEFASTDRSPPPPIFSTPTPTKAPTNILTPTLTPSISPTSPPTPASGNFITNSSFENGTQSWSFFTDGAGEFTTGSSAYEGASSAKVAITTEGSNVQLYQKGINLDPNTQYSLTFAAYSNTGHDLDVKLHKHGEPFTNYGLDTALGLGTTWETFSLDFITNDLGGSPVVDGRLRFWLAPYDEAGDEYFIDAVSLTKSNTICTFVGDINCDGVVNILDFQVISNNFGTSDPDSDLNGDGIVNILDFQILNNNFGQTGG